MGYYTAYTLCVKHPQMNESIVAAIGAKMEELGFGEIFDDGYLDGNFAEFYANDIYKWYGHEDDMRKLSEAFPEAIFQLHGHGEDSDDFWYKYFHNGNSELCRGQIVYPKPTIVRW